MKLYHGHGNCITISRKNLHVTVIFLREILQTGFFDFCAVKNCRWNTNTKCASEYGFHNSYNYIFSTYIRYIAACYSSSFYKFVRKTRNFFALKNHYLQNIVLIIIKSQSKLTKTDSRSSLHCLPLHFLKSYIMNFVVLDFKVCEKELPSLHTISKDAQTEG